MKRIAFACLLVIPVTAANVAFADPPDMKSPTPVIHLADNLDEADNLGWCIDTFGRGLSDRLNAHSCKPQGGDVQFRYVRKADIERCDGVTARLGASLTLRHFVSPEGFKGALHPWEIGLIEAYLVTWCARHISRCGNFLGIIFLKNLGNEHIYAAKIGDCLPGAHSPPSRPIIGAEKLGQACLIHG